MADQPKCQLCGEPMPAGEEMFNYHGYSGPCPKPFLPTPSLAGTAETMTESDAESVQRHIKVCVESVKLWDGTSPYGDFFRRILATYAALASIRSAVEAYAQDEDAATHFLNLHPVRNEHFADALIRWHAARPHATPEGTP